MKNHSFLIYILVIAITMAITSCQNRIIHVSIPENSCKDSTLLYITDSIYLNIGSELNPIPYVSQLYISDSTEIYIAKDEQKLYFYNIFKDSLLFKVKLDNCSPLKSYSGFNHLGDRTIIYNYLSKEIVVLGKKFDIIERITLNNSLLHIEALSGSPLLFSKENIILSGSPNLNPYRYKGLYPVSIAYSLKEKKITIGGARPEFYQKKNIGGNYMWRVFHTMNSDGNIVYSFPLSPYIEIYSNKLIKDKNIYMGSRYSNLPLEMNTSLFDVLTDYKEKIYYLNEHTYGPIIFDKFRNVYYRIATHPKENYREGDMTLKPFSIIVMNHKGVILSETPIFYHNNTMFYDKIYISSRGLLMQSKSENENIIKFLVFTF